MIRLIAAIDKYGGIARGGRLSWQLPTDHAYFLEQTKRFGGNILRGRKEYEVYGHPLKGRHNYVLSRTKIDTPGVTWVPDLDEFLDTFSEDLWVIGGADVYAQTIGRAGELYLTEINRDYNCDQFFPHFGADFHLSGPRTAIKENGVQYTFGVYTRGTGILDT